MKRFLLFAILAALCFTVISYATQARQSTRMLTVRVIDESGEALPYVSITVDGTTIGAVADVDGVARLRIPTSECIVKISLIGYLTQSCRIPEGTNDIEIEIRLREDDGELNW